MSIADHATNRGEGLIRISVFGLGYMGSVVAACLAEDGHQVTGVDVDPVKVHCLRKGIAPIREPGLNRVLAQALAAGTLTATSDAAKAVAASDLALICVGTPTALNHDVDLSFVLAATREIGRAIKDTPSSYTVILRSSVPPGTTRDKVLPTLQNASGKVVGEEIYLYYNPEFLRQGSALNDFRQPPFTVVGTLNTASFLHATLVERLYRSVRAPLVMVNYQEAELLKLACNSYHAIKIDFANEIGTLAQLLDADPARVMDVFVMDTKLNVAPAYLRPGFAFGGSCLPKDVRALNYIATRHGVKLPLHGAILRSNEAHLERIAAGIVGRDDGTIGVVGLAFKSNTDDLRESPALRLVEKLIRAGKDVVVHEPELLTDRLTDTNLEYLTDVLPDFTKRLVDWKTLQDRAHLLLVTRAGIVPHDELVGLKTPCMNLAELVAQTQPHSIA